MAIKFLNTTQVQEKTLYADAANDRIGIRTNTPLHPLDVDGDVVFRHGTNNKKVLFSEEGKDDVMIGDIEGMYQGAYFDMQYKADVAHFNKCKVGVGTASPAADLQVTGGIQMGNDSSNASAALAGTLRYRTNTSGATKYSYVDMCMQIGATSWKWINIVQNSWT